MPDSATVSVPCAGSLVVIVSEAARAPMAEGLNVTLIAQVVLVAGATGAARVPVHPLERMKSPGLVPDSGLTVNVSGTGPELETVTV